MENKYIERTIGKCLNENKLIEYDSVVLKCKLFFKVSQFRSIEGMTVSEIEDLGIKLETTPPKCGDAQRVYGVFLDGQIIKLTEIIDSSD